VNMIARSADGIVDFNLFPAYGNSHEVYQLLANSFSHSAVPEPSYFAFMGGGLLLVGL